jgi:hypothetical protein
MSHDHLAQLDQLADAQDAAFKQVRSWTAALLHEGGPANRKTCEQLSKLVRLIADQNQALCTMAGALHDRKAT